MASNWWKGMGFDLSLWVPTERYRGSLFRWPCWHTRCKLYHQGDVLSPLCSTSQPVHRRGIHSNRHRWRSLLEVDQLDRYRQREATGIQLLAEHNKRVENSKENYWRQSVPLKHTSFDFKCGGSPLLSPHRCSEFRVTIRDIGDQGLW